MPLSMKTRVSLPSTQTHSITRETKRSGRFSTTWRKPFVQRQPGQMICNRNPRETPASREARLIYRRFELFIYSYL